MSTSGINYLFRELSLLTKIKITTTATIESLVFTAQQNIVQRGVNKNRRRLSKSSDTN